MDQKFNLSSLCEGNTDEKAIVKGLFRVMKEFGYTLDQIRTIPLTHHEILIKLINEEDRKARSKAKGRK